MMLLWLTARARSEFMQSRSDEVTERRLERAGLPQDLPDTLARTLEVSRCMGLLDTRTAQDCPEVPPAKACALEESVERLLLYSRSRNPYFLRAALESGGCYREVTRDSRSGRPWMLIAGARNVELVPLRAGLLRRGNESLVSPEDIAGALALGLATLRIGMSQ